MSRSGASSRAAASTCPSIGRPHTSFSIFGVLVRIRVPSPAARTMTAAGPSAVTRLGSSASICDRAVWRGLVAHLSLSDLSILGVSGYGVALPASAARAREVTLPTWAGYRPVTYLRPAWVPDRTCATLAHDRATNSVAPGRTPGAREREQQRHSQPASWPAYGHRYPEPRPPTCGENILRFANLPTPGTAASRNPWLAAPRVPIPFPASRSPRADSSDTVPHLRGCSPASPWDCTAARGLPRRHGGALDPSTTAVHVPVSGPRASTFPGRLTGRTRFWSRDRRFESFPGSKWAHIGFILDPKSGARAPGTAGRAARSAAGQPSRRLPSLRSAGRARTLANVDHQAAVVVLAGVLPDRLRIVPLQRRSPELIFRQPGRRPARTAGQPRRPRSRGSETRQMSRSDGNAGHVPGTPGRTLISRGSLLMKTTCSSGDDAACSWRPRTSTRWRRRSGSLGR